MDYVWGPVPIRHNFGTWPIHVKSCVMWVVCAGSGSAIYAIDKGKNWDLLFTYIFVILLISAVKRAGFYAVAIAFSLHSVWSKKFSHLLHVSLATLVADIFYQLYVGFHASVFLRGDIATHWVENVSSMNRVQGEFSPMMASTESLSGSR